MREIIRETAQLDLEDSIPKDERNVNGQYATPFALAKEIVTGTFQLCPQATAILEPACGTGSFISAIRSLSNDVHIVGYEKDSRFASVAQSIWNDKYTKIFNDDFLSALPHEHSKYDLIITNPPYSRHHHLSDKAKEKYKAEHADDLKRFYEARRKITARFPDGKYDSRVLDEEYAKLEQEYAAAYEQFKAVRSDSQTLWKIKSHVDTARQNMERKQEQNNRKRQEQEL